LEINGLDLSHFSTREEAFACAEGAVKQNSIDFKFKIEKIDNPEPLLVRYKYFQGHGTKRSWSSTDSTSVSGVFEPKTKKALEDFSAASQCLMGGNVPGASGGQEKKVKVESPIYEELKLVTAGLRPYKT